MTSIQFTPPMTGAYLSEIVPFYEGSSLDLLLLWNVGNGSADAPLQILQYDASTSSFFNDTSSIFSGLVPDLADPRNVTLVNLNGEGPSFIIAEQGLDQSPFPGATDTLLLATSNGQLTNASANLPQSLAFTHDVSSGVINGAGNIGVFFNVIYSQSNISPYYLISNGDGTFVNGSASYLPASLQSTYPAYTSSALVDLTGNGLSDLVLGAEDLTQGASLVYINPGNGDFSNVTPIDLPAPPIAATPGLNSSSPTGPITLDIEPINISSPSYDDLVVISTSGNYEAYAIQILINDGTGHFVDQTADRLIGAPSYVTYPSTDSQINWLVRSFIVELNGSPDIVTQSNNNAPSQVFLNNGSGVFYLAYSDTQADNPIMAVVTISGTATLIEANGNLVPYESPPQVTSQTPAHTIIDGEAFSFTLTSNTFTDPRGEQLTYTATGPADTALPSWITFNSSTLTFSGEPPAAASAFTVMVTATDTDGWMMEENFTVTPTTFLTAVTDTGATIINAGHLVTITMNFSAPATVTDTPTLQLNDNEVAYYTGGSGTNALSFAYVPIPTDNVADLQVTGLNLPTGASVTDANGNNLSGPVTGDLGLTITGPVTPATVVQEINGLYVTLYGLAATAAGIAYWENVLSNFDPSVTTANAATTPISVADQTYLGQQMTAGSPQVNGTSYFATLYPASMSDMAFVQALYQNMSDFIGTTAGDNYWYDLLQQTEASNGGNVIAARESIAGQFVHDFMSNDLTLGAAAWGLSQSDYTLLVNGQQTLLNKVVVSQYYADETQASGGSIINYTSVTDAAFTASHNVAASITDDSATAAVAIAGINNAIAHQNLSLI